MRTQYVIFSVEKNGTRKPAMSAGAFRDALKSSTFSSREAAERTFEVVSKAHKHTVISEQHVDVEGVVVSSKDVREHRQKGFLERLRRR